MKSIPLTADFFQIGYVCDNLDAALPSLEASSKDGFLIVDVAALGGAPDAPVKRIALGYLGALNVELLEIRSEVDSIFRDALRPDGAPGLHHLGYLVADDAGWSSLTAEIEAGGGAAMAGRTEGALSFLYVDRRADLGHYLEYVKLEAGGRALFDAVPRGQLTFPSQG